MKKSLFIFGIITIFSIIALSGCQEETTQNTNNLENIELESEVVELAYANFTKNMQDNKIVSVSVEYLFKNIVERDLNINITAEFYDKDNSLLYTGGPKNIYLPQGWTEKGVGPANSISYDGEDAAKADHVKIIAEEI